MSKTENDVLNEWVRRGYLKEHDDPAFKQKCLSFIRQAKDSILSYCNITLKADMPDGLFYAWVDIALESARNVAGIPAVETDALGTVKSVTEGDTTVTFATGECNVAPQNAQSAAHYAAILRRYRRMP